MLFTKNATHLPRVSMIMVPSCLIHLIGVGSSLGFRSTKLHVKMIPEPMRFTCCPLGVIIKRVASEKNNDK